MDESISLRELVDVDIVQAIQDSFAKTVGVSSVIFLPDGDALTRFSNPIKFCTLIQSTKEGRRRCFQSFAEMSRKAVELSEPEIMYCFAHGAHFVAPIIIDGERKATMYAGQFRPEKFSPEQLKELEKIAVEIDLDPESLVEEAKNMRTVRDTVVMNCLQSFFQTVKVIAELGAQAAELRQTKEALQKAHDELEIRVQERTAELTETNKELRREIAERKAAEGALRESEEKYRTLIENVQDGVFLIQDGELKFVNEPFARISGYTVEEILGMGFGGFVALDDRDMVADRYVRMMAGEDVPMEYEFHGIQKNGVTRTTVYMTVGLIEYQGEPAVIGTLKDITGQKQAEDALWNSESRYCELFDNMMDGIVVHRLIVDEDGEPVDYVLEKINNAAERILSWKRADIEGKLATEVYGGDTPFIERYDRVAQTGESAHFVDYYPRFKRWYEVTSFCPIRGYFVNVFKDITERKEAEDALRGSEEKLRSIVEQSSDGIVLVDEQGTIIEWNRGQERIIGLSQAEVLGRPMWDVMFQVAANEQDNPALYERIKSGVLKILETGQSEWLDRLEERVVRRPDGARRVIQVAVFPIKTGKGFMAGAISRDITEQKQAEDALRKSENKYRALFETAKDAIFLSDETGNFVDVNQAACESLGYSREELLRLSNREIDADPTGYEVFLKVRDTLAKEAIFEVNQRRKDGTLLPVEITGKFFKIDGELLSLAIARDITERKAAEEQIKRSLREKDVLMQEIHHRVKNNLQVVSSLLSMQARTTRNKEAIDVLSKSQSRINTMALIHTQLYESGDLSELNMKEFVGTLSEQLFRSYQVNDTKIARSVHVTDHKFPVSVGVHVGLIINELLSNALQHAFGEGDEGKIEVSLTAPDSGRVNLRVSDDGVGLPPGFDINATKTLGLRLVKILVEDQLQGKLEVISDEGVTFNMEFDIEGNGGSSYGENKNTDR